MNLARSDLFSELCEAIGLSGNNLVALVDELQFYADAGGNHDRSNIAVGGYIGTVAQWKAFRDPWRDALVDEGVECFHRSEMEPPFFGEFKKRGWTQEHQKRVLNRLHTIIKKHTIKGTAHAVGNKSFAQLIPPRIKQIYGGPYGWCVLLEIVEIGLWARRLDQWITYFFEAGDTGGKQANTIISNLYNSSRYKELFRIRGWGFYPKKGEHAILQLQPADFIAYEAYKDIENFLAGMPRSGRRSRKDLIRPTRDELRLWTDTTLAQWLARLADFGGDVIETLITNDPKS